MIAFKLYVLLIVAELSQWQKFKGPKENQITFFTVIYTDWNETESKSIKTVASAQV